MGLIHRQRNRRINLLLCVALAIAGFVYIHKAGDVPSLLNAFSFPTGQVHFSGEQGVDVFANFEGRDTCGFGSNDLHTQFPGTPMCQDRQSLLEAISYGGRTGFDGPYIPRGCDMKFYSTEEICHILGRFEGIIVIGDSLARHLVTALSIVLRQNLHSGGQMSWMERTKEHGCYCDHQYFLFLCHATDIRNMTEVYNNDPASFGCPFLERPTINFGEMPKYPLELFGDYVDEFIEGAMHPQRTPRPYAFILSQGLWNDCNVTETLAWIDQVQARIALKRPYLAQHAPVTRSPRIFVTPSAPGEAKQNEFLVGQGNQAVMRFEKLMRREIRRYPGMDFLGTYNMSVQGSVPDGTHAGIRTNLLKAMAVVNWLDWVDTKEWERQAPYWTELEQQDDSSRKLAWEQALQDLTAEEQARFKTEYKKLEGLEEAQQEGQHEPSPVVTDTALLDAANDNAANQDAGDISVEVVDILPADENNPDDASPGGSAAPDDATLNGGAPDSALPPQEPPPVPGPDITLPAGGPVPP